MRKNIIVALIITFSIGFAGCQKALEEKPKSFLSPDQFFNSEQACVQAVNGVYAGIPAFFNANEFSAVTEIGCDDIIRNGVADIVQTYQYLPLTTGGSDVVWTLSYTSIMRANLVINRLKTAPISDAMRARLTGESKTIRAFFYFVLANTFGDVPLWNDELKVDAVGKLPRVPLADVRKQIVSDLTDAAAGLPNRFTGADIGRVNKATALTLLTKEYLMEKNWTAAKATALIVTQMPEYTLVPDYGILFDYKTRNSAESIFEIQYLRDIVTDQVYLENRRYTFFMPPADAKLGVFAGVNFGNTRLRSYSNFYPSKTFVSFFEPNDARTNVVMATGFNGKSFSHLNSNGSPYFGPKFWDLDANDFHSGRNLMFLRLADVYMALAEAENELGNTPGAYPWINKIRTRAKLPNLVGLTQQQMRDAIYKEDAIEFCGEFKRRWDLVRWGKLIDAVKSVATDNVLGAANIQPYHILFPVSTDELIKNGNLTQNPGYPQ